MTHGLRTVRAVSCALLGLAMPLCGEAAAQEVEEILSYEVLVDVRPGGRLLGRSKGLG